jgi:hypothetical protein
VVSSGTPISFTNNADRHDISEIFLKVALSTIKNEQSRETGNTEHTRRRKTKQNTTQYVLDTPTRKQIQTA